MKGKENKGKVRTALHLERDRLIVEEVQKMISENPGFKKSYVYELVGKKYWLSKTGVNVIVQANKLNSKIDK